jgi:hypothetical protein
LLLLDVFVHLVQVTDEFLCPVVVSESYPDCSVAVKNYAFQCLVDFHHTFLHNSPIDVLYYELFFHLRRLLVENQQVARDSVDHLLGFVFQLKRLRCCTFQ